MFDAILITTLRNDAELASYVSTHTLKNGSTIPAMFGNSAPEGVNFPYITTRISDVGNDDDSVVDAFAVTINIFGYGKSGINERNASKRIIALLDREHLSDDYYDNIRFLKSGNDYVETKDPKAQHYNVRFSARAGRSGWMSTL